MENNNVNFSNLVESFQNEDSRWSSSSLAVVTSSSDTSSSCSKGCLVVLGLCVGDSLGATSEFQIPWEVPTNCMMSADRQQKGESESESENGSSQSRGWPAKLVGGGKAGWEIGAPTDDSCMAIAIVRAVMEEKGRFNGATVLKHFLKWSRGKPKDIGATTALTLQRAIMEYPYNAGRWYYQKNPNAFANGSLMRNGVIAALFPRSDQEIDALDATVLHGIITHYAPLSVMCCVVHTLLIREALLDTSATKKAPTLDNIKHLINTKWKNWKDTTSHPDTKQWLKEVEKKLKSAELQLIQELQGFESYDPYNQDYRGRSGYVVLTLQISLWALHWSFQPDHPKLAEWLPQWPFMQHEFATLMWVVLVGADADTYAATAGPLLAAYHLRIEENFLHGLQLRSEIETLFKNSLEMCSQT